jgi:hypothetical protein
LQLQIFNHKGFTIEKFIPCVLAFILIFKSIEIASPPLTTKNLSVPATKGMVLGKFERHHGTKIKNMSKMVTGSENDPTIGLKNSSQDGNGHRGKKC